MQYDMVFEGGGAKGMVFVGALEVFLAQGHTHGRLLGTSAGAITAALLAAGYRPDEMLEVLAEKVEGHSVFAGFMATPPALEKDSIHTSATRALLRSIDIPGLPERFEEKLDDSLVGWLAAQPSLRSVFSFIERGGWFSADNFITWIALRLDTGTNAGQPRKYSKMTLREFYQTTQIDLSLVAADTTKGLMLVLNHRTAPNCPTVWAIRMSMGCPFAWPEVTWHAEWGQYRGRDLTGHRVVDGGLLSNFPIRLFVSSDENIDEIMGENSISDQVIGLLIDETLPVPGIEEPLRDAAAPSFIGRLDLLQQTLWRVQGLADTVLGGNDRTVLAAYEHMVCRLPAKSVGTLDFDMPEERMSALVAAGDAAMEAYLTALES